MLESNNIELSMDEPCLSIMETDLPTGLPGQGTHRYQLIRVIRGDDIDTYKEDLGPATAFAADGFYIACSVIKLWNGSETIMPENPNWRDIQNVWIPYPAHTVGEMRDSAYYLRLVQVPVTREASDLITAYENLREKSIRKLNSYAFT